LLNGGPADIGGPPAIAGGRMRSLNRLSLAIYFLLLSLSPIPAAPIGSVLAQDQKNAPNFMQSMDLGMSKMNSAMVTAPMNGDVDHDFAVMMIPHHQGAIDMAKSELLFGRDPVMRRLAQEILVDQQSEIDAMNLWLDKRAGTRQKVKTP
jgi:hypothetical protein